jgi:hypothetical protein
VLVFHLLLHSSEIFFVSCIILPFWIKCHTTYKKLVPVFLPYTSPYKNGRGFGDDASSLALHYHQFVQEARSCLDHKEK